MPDNHCPHLPIECQRLRLRDFLRSDLEQFTEYRANPDIARYQGWDEFCTADANEFFATLLPLKFSVAGTWYQVAIANRETDQLIGDCVIHFTGDDSLVEIGFTLAPEFHGHGYAHEAISALDELIFNTLGKKRIVAITHAHNDAAHRLLKRLGFDSREHVSADPDPELIHSLDYDDWAQLQNSA